MDLLQAAVVFIAHPKELGQPQGKMANYGPTSNRPNERPTQLGLDWPKALLSVLKHNIEGRQEG